jgi:hypothetical protein
MGSVPGVSPGPAVEWNDRPLDHEPGGAPGCPLGQESDDLVRSDVFVDFDVVSFHANSHSGKGAEGFRKALRGGADEDEVEVRDRDVVFPYVYAFHDGRRSGGVLRLVLTQEATPCLRMARRVPGRCINSFR